MKTKRIGIMILALLMLSSVALLANVRAVIWPNLPLTPVQLTVVDGAWDTSYFISTLSGVPGGFDVQNGVYPGWCIDRYTTMIRNEPHNVILYSSLSPPSVLSGINWNAINYILNHKQGFMSDVQNAIWYFAGQVADLSADAQAMIDAANANPGYVPTTGEILAIICLPVEDPGCQNSIIELTTPPPPPSPGLTPGFWKNNLAVYLGLANGERGYSDPTGSPTVTKDTMGDFFASLDDTKGGPYDLMQLYRDLCPQLDGITADIRNAAANIFNVAAGLSPGPPWV